MPVKEVKYYFIEPVLPAEVKTFNKYLMANKSTDKKILSLAKVVPHLGYQDAAQLTGAYKFRRLSVSLVGTPSEVHPRSS